MANILSQNEIDELLSVLASGRDTGPQDVQEEDATDIKPYDFRTANKFSKDQMRTFHFIYDNFANRLSTHLSGTLRTICEVKIASIEEQSFQEFSNSMPTPVIASIISMMPLTGTMLLEISPAIAYEIVSRLLGGAGQQDNTSKPFTEIEISLLERVVRQMLIIMNEAWEKINAVNASLERIETSSQYVQIVSANEPIAIITLQVKIGKISDIINLCIPHVSVQPIAKKLVMKAWYADKINTAIDDKNRSAQLSGIYINLQALFNTTKATVGDIVNTEVGDVIQIDHKINEPVTLKVEHLPKFKAAIGIQGINYAVQIVNILKEEADNEFIEICEQ